jgi:hypothetical protein
MGAILPRNLAFCEADQPCGCMRERMRATYGASLNSHLGRLWERRALGPPSLGEVVVHTTRPQSRPPRPVGEPGIPP